MFNKALSRQYVRPSRESFLAGSGPAKPTKDHGDRKAT